MKARFVKILMGLVVVASMSYGVAALAQDYGQEAARAQAQLPTMVAGESTIPGIIGRLVAYGLSIVGIVFFFLILYAGFLWMSAMGNTEKTETAKHIMEAAVIGLVLVLGAYAITSFVFTGLTTGDAGGGASNQQSGELLDPYNCKIGNDGEKCSYDGGNTCVGGKCVVPCLQKYADKNPVCIDTGACNRVVVAGLCPKEANNIQCCHD